MFTEEKLGLTLKCQDDTDDEDQLPRTIVKSANGAAQISNQIHVGRNYVREKFLCGCSGKLKVLALCVAGRRCVVVGQ